MDKVDVDIRSINHSCTHLRYHIVLVCKFRRKVINREVEGHLSKIFTDIGEKSHFDVKHVGFDKDHVHLFVKSVPSFSVLEIVRRLKQVSTRRLWGICPDYLSRYYWKGHPLWTRGYYCSTVGGVTEESVIRYINNQGKDSPAKLKI